MSAAWADPHWQRAAATGGAEAAPALRDAHDQAPLPSQSLSIPSPGSRPLGVHRGVPVIAVTRGLRPAIAIAIHARFPRRHRRRSCVIQTVRDLGRTRVDGRIRVIAIAGDLGKPVPVVVVRGGPFIHGAIAIIVEAIRGLDCTGTDVRVAVVAIPTRAGHAISVEVALAVIGRTIAIVIHPVAEDLGRRNTVASASLQSPSSSENPSPSSSTQEVPSSMSPSRSLSTPSQVSVPPGRAGVVVVAIIRTPGGTVAVEVVRPVPVAQSFARRVTSRSPSTVGVATARRRLIRGGKARSTDAVSPRRVQEAAMRPTRNPPHPTASTVRGMLPVLWTTKFAVPVLPGATRPKSTSVG